MASDDPIEAFEQQYMRDEPTLPRELAEAAGKVGGELTFPGLGGLAVEILLKARKVLFDPVSTTERNLAMWEMFKMQFRHIEETKTSHDDVQKAIQLAFLYDRYERDDEKRERYVNLIGNALRSEDQIHDVATFVQIIEQMNERDVNVLKVLNRVMNKEGDWKPQSSPLQINEKVHPSVFIQRAQELSLAVATALGQDDVGTSYFSREEGYMVCTRLQGFGLAHEVQVSDREVPVSNYSFRLSVQGVRLLKLLGEDVPNYKWYVKGLCGETMRVALH